MVYLIHLKEKYKHAQHYLGFVERNLKGRIKKHKAGQGAKFLRAVNQAAIPYEVVRVWDQGTREMERTLKNQKNTARFCPTCQQKKRSTAKQLKLF